MTRQIGDYLFYEDVEYQLLGAEALPENDTRVVKLTDEEYKELHNNGTNTTACRREFISSWEIKDDKLYLNRVRGRYKLSTRVPVVADWYTDILKIPAGKMLHQDLVTPLGDIYESEIHLNIEKGVVVNSVVIDRREEYESTYGSMKVMTREEAIEKLRWFAKINSD